MNLESCCFHWIYKSHGHFTVVGGSECWVCPDTESVTLQVEDRALSCWWVLQSCAGAGWLWFCCCSLKTQLFIYFFLRAHFKHPLLVWSLRALLQETAAPRWGEPALLKVGADRGPSQVPACRVGAGSATGSDAPGLAPWPVSFRSASQNTVCR